MKINESKKKKRKEKEGDEAENKYTKGELKETRWSCCNHDRAFFFFFFLDFIYARDNSMSITGRTKIKEIPSSVEDFTEDGPVIACKETCLNF